MTTMKKFITLAIFLVAGISVSAQDFLGIYPGYSDGPTPNSSQAFVDGPEYTVNPVYFSVDSSTAPSFGQIGVSSTYSDQQYIDLTTLEPSDPEFDALMFGVADNNNDKSISEEAIFDGMNNVAQPDEDYFSPTESSVGIGLDPTDQYAFIQYVSNEGIPQEPTDGRYYMGQVTYTFTEPVDNPLMHVTGLGGFLALPDLGTTFPYSVDMEITTTGISLEYISGTLAPENTPAHSTGDRIFDVNGNTIFSDFQFEDFGIASAPLGTQGDWAGTGTVKLTGTDITTVTFNLFMQGKLEEQQWTSFPGDMSVNEVFAGDRYNVTFTLPLYDFSGAVIIDNQQNGNTAPEDGIDPATGNNLMGGPYTSSSPDYEQVYAVLVNDEGVIVQIDAVDPATGFFEFDAVLSNDYAVVLTTADNLVVGDPAPTVTLPTEYNTTEETFADGGSDGNPNSIAGFTNVDNSNASNIDESNLIIGISQIEFVAQPVEGLVFSAEADDNNAELSWSTQTETNSDYFEVQRSINNLDYEVVGTVDAAGTTSEEQSYEFTDVNAGDYASVVYYRLRQVDLDNESVFSNVEQVEFDKFTEVKVFPNPAVKGEQVQVSAQKIKSVAVYGVDGQIHNRYEFDEQNRVTIQTSELSSGTYILLINDRVKKKFVVQ